VLHESANSPLSPLRHAHSRSPGRKAEEGLGDGGGAVMAWQRNSPGNSVHQKDPAGNSVLPGGVLSRRAGSAPEMGLTSLTTPPLARRAAPDRAEDKYPQNGSKNGSNRAPHETSPLAAATAATARRPSDPPAHARTSFARKPPAVGGGRRAAKGAAGGLPKRVLLGGGGQADVEISQVGVLLRLCCSRA